MIKTNIKMKVTPEQSKKVQEICFENGIVWKGEPNNNLLFLERPYIFILKHLETANKSYDFENDELEEITTDLFIRTNGTCEENVILDKGAKSCDMLQSENKKLQKKIENLHIALNKKVAKNKNQKAEITILLKQKEELKKEISYKQNNDNGTIELLKQGQVVLDDLNKTIDLLEDRIKEKDTIISYLESRLK